MKNLIMKEIRLSMHPTCLVFLALSAMLLIPNYPYGVTFFYTSLAIFFTCLSGRENNDITYTAVLPVRKRDVVKGRFALAVLLQLAQLVTAVPFTALRSALNMRGSMVGMDPNIAFFGFAFVIMGIFNIAFFTAYYKDVQKVGRPFVVAAVLQFVFIGLMETLAHVLPFFRDVLDTPDPENLGPKLAALAVGAAVYGALTFIAYRVSVVRFERMDL